MYSKMIHLYIHMYIFFSNFSHLNYYWICTSPLCYTVDPCWLSILYKVVYMSIQSSQFTLPHFSPSVIINLFPKSVSLFLFCK